MKKLIDIEQFCVSVGSFSLKNINLQIYENEIFAILGKTGSGKTVLLESIAGFYKSEEGSIKIYDKKVNDTPLENRKIGFVYQDYGLFPHMTVFNNIAYGLKIQKINKKIIKSTVEEICKILSIEKVLNQYPGTLSGGEKQRTALARSVVLKPKILLMDEPFSALDPTTKLSMYDEIKKIHKIFGCTIIFVTHDFNEAQIMADRIGILKSGELKSVRKSKELFNEYKDEDINKFLGIRRGKYYDKRGVISNIT